MERRKFGTASNCRLSSAAARRTTVAITQEDVAHRAGVSRALVSLVMRNVPRVSPASREAVLKAAAELGYQPDINAARLASHRTKTIGVVLAQLHNPVYPETFTGAESRTEE